MASIVPKFIDDPVNVVGEVTSSLCTLRANCRRIANTNVIVADNMDTQPVLLVCGGGSGHEPAHAGFVADGWLSAAVCGNVFASPPTAHVTAAIEYLAKRQGQNGAGILVIVKNYAGDLLNFGFAVRQAQQRGIRCEMVLAADDAVFGTTDVSRRRGLAGCCLLYKALGVAAVKGHSLAQLKNLAERLSARMRTIGASLSSCAMPGGPASSTLPANTVEIGLGIHGERGLMQVPFTGVTDLVERIMDILYGVKNEDKCLSPLPRQEKVLVLVNNLGSTTDLEMSLIAGHTVRYLQMAGSTVIGIHVGRHMTSLEMHGFSITVLTVTDESDLEFLLNTNDFQAPLMNFHVPHGGQMEEWEIAGPRTALQIAQKQNQAEPTGLLFEAQKDLYEHLKGAEASLNAMDAAVGDGDLGSGVRRAATAAAELLPLLPWASAPKTLEASFSLLSKAVAEECGGTSGPLLGTLLLGGGAGAAQVLRTNPTKLVAAMFAAISRASEEVQKLGGAHPGDRTMVDVLDALTQSAAVEQAASLPEMMAEAHAVAVKAAAATATLPAKFGRSRYLDGKEVGLPDPGAELIVMILGTLHTFLQHHH